jgi:hypothetical protein
MQGHRAGAEKWSAELVYSEGFEHYRGAGLSFYIGKTLIALIKRQKAGKCLSANFVRNANLLLSDALQASFLALISYKMRKRVKFPLKRV